MNGLFIGLTFALSNPLCGPNVVRHLKEKHIFNFFLKYIFFSIILNLELTIGFSLVKKIPEVWVKIGNINQFYMKYLKFWAKKWNFFPLKN